MHANKIIDVFKEKDIPVECVNLGDDEYGFNIYVDSEFYEKACLVARDIENEYYTYLKITQKCPKLVNAEVGDFVGIFNKYDVGIKDVGIVTSKRKTDEGFSYGCRYIIPVIDESIKTSRVKFGSNFQLTDENYGGFHQGFLAVISHEEMTSILQKEIDKQYDSALKQAETKKNNCNKKLSEFLKALNKGNKQQTEIWNLKKNENEYWSEIPTDMYEN